MSEEPVPIEASLAVLTQDNDDIDAVLNLIKEIPVVGTVVNVAIASGVLLLDMKRPDRVFPVLRGLWDQQEKIKREYVKKEEFADLLLEGLRRAAEQPDPARREDLRTIILKITREPRRHDEHLMFIRWADELPLEALRVLAAVHEPVPGPLARNPNAVLRNAADLLPDQIDFWMEFLANQGLFDRTKFHAVAPPSGMDYLLTVLGKKFEDYRRG
jgi:hypothetical protein